jgi:hypothetical protein
MERHAPRVTNPRASHRRESDRWHENLHHELRCLSRHARSTSPASARAFSSIRRPAISSSDPLDDPEWHIYYSIRTGVRYSGMPAWDKTLTDQDIWKVTAFLSRIEKLPPKVQDYWKKAFGVTPLPHGHDSTNETDKAAF